MNIFLFTDNEKIVGSFVSEDLEGARQQLSKYLSEQKKQAEELLKKSSDELDVRKNGYDEFVKKSDEYMAQEKDKEQLSIAKASREDSESKYKTLQQEVKKYQKQMKKNIDLFSKSVDKFSFARMELMNEPYES